MNSTLPDSSTFAGQWHRYWRFVLDVALTVWVLRAPVAALVVGYLILWVTPQGQDLFVDLAMADAAAWTWFLAVLFFVWAAPTEYASHILLITDERYCRPVGGKRDRFRVWLKVWSPKILGLLVFVCVLGAVIRSWLNVPSLPSDEIYVSYVSDTHVDMRIVAFALTVISLSVTFLCYSLAREEIARTKIVRAAERAAAKILGPFRRWLPPIFALHRGRHGRSEIESDLGPLLLFLMFILFAALPTIYPLKFAAWFPRADAVPFVIGGWIPLLAILSGLGRRLHAPLLLFLLFVRIFLASGLSPNYRIDTIEASRGADASISLTKAITWWKSANCDKDGQKCHRPIIVAAAGGASHAGFFTADVIGQLLDDELTGNQMHGHALPSQQVIKRIFAFSTVSGSSIAAVMSVAAMAAARSDGGPPCQNSSDEYWNPSANLKLWRGCLETLLSGDFLTPVFTGLVFHDMMRFWHMRDRGWLLEQSWRDQFREVLGSRKPDPTSPFCVGSLACPFTTLRPTSERWLPLLLLNGTSVATGQRIVTTLLAPTYSRIPNGHCSVETSRPQCNLFLDAYRFHDLLNAGTSPSSHPEERNKMRDIDLATAALNSARFPLVSPPGEIRDQNGRVVDNIVDGGYFENFGAQTATELAQAIVAIDPTLDPFVLVLSNDPEATQQEIDAKYRRVDGDSGSLVPDVSAPITTFANTRNARGALAIDEAGALLFRPERESCHLAQIRVWGELVGDSGQRDISMSWWLSKPLQLELHEQTEFDGQGHPTNSSAEQNSKEIGKLLTVLEGPSPVGEAEDQPSCPKG